MTRGAFYGLAGNRSTGTVDWWGVQTPPEHLLQRAIDSFQDHFPIVMRHLTLFPKNTLIVAEGFGLTPELLYPHFTHPHQAIGLVPTVEFKKAAMQRRDKPTWQHQTSNPDTARQNLYARGRLLTAYIKHQTEVYQVPLYEVDGAQSIEEMVQLVEHHFAPFLTERLPSKQRYPSEHGRNREYALRNT